MENILIHQASLGSRLRYVYLLLCVILCVSPRVAAEENSPWIKVKPKQCVSLKRGQTCYTTALVKWNSNKKGNYCIQWNTKRDQNSDASEKNIRCFEGESGGKFEIDLEIHSDIEFKLIDSDHDQELANSELEYAWVYNVGKRAQQAWRLF